MSRGPRLPLLITFLILAASGSALASGVRGTEIERVLLQIAGAQKKIETIEARFRQEKSSGLLAASEVSVGSFVFSRPNRAIWRYEEPKAIEMLVSDGWLTTWYPELGRAERIEVKRYEERIFRYLGATAGAIADLDSYFDFRLINVKAKPYYTLILTPKTERVAKRVQRIEVRVDRTSYLTTSLDYTEGDGDRTRYDFTEIRVNEPRSRKRLELSLPPTVRVETLPAAGK
ncbi:MAG TPA: outer membrane lipoprotein carrier protein LolA [Thermoanaerobaculia bacterium]|nr:outer membrane lipoprotein carrier protein LolA [Thermoanaerobaculia bacterium]